MIHEEDVHFIERFSKTAEADALTNFLTHKIEDLRERLENATTLEELHAAKSIIRFVKEEIVKPLQLGSVALKKSETREYH